MMNSEPTPAMDGLLVREAHHRLMHTLTILVGQLRAARDAPDAHARSVIDQSMQMICAHGRLHAALMVERQGAILVSDYVPLLCQQISDAILEPLGIRCEVVADDGVLRAATAATLGLIIHELVVNAAKHAFTLPTRRVVRVEVLRRDRGWTCTVTDNGRGLPAPSGVTGQGAGIIEGLVHQLGGSLARRSCSAGTSVAVLLPQAS